MMSRIGPGTEDMLLYAGLTNLATLTGTRLARCSTLVRKSGSLRDGMVPPEITSMVFRRFHDSAYRYR